jgi:hypothetical protein
MLKRWGQMSKTPSIKKRIFGIEDLKFFKLNAKGDGYVPCKPETANAASFDGIMNTGQQN